MGKNRENFKIKHTEKKKREEHFMKWRCRERKGTAKWRQANRNYNEAVC